MPGLFETFGDGLDIGYVNLRDQGRPTERRMVESLEAMWVKYEPYADPDFVAAFARDPEARFWEMFVGCTLLDAGKTLLLTADRQAAGGQPDVCIIDGDQRIWIEAIAPAEGDIPEDQIPKIVPINEGGRLRASPIRQVQLRITSALWTKSQVIQNYLDQGVIAQTEPCLIAIGAGRFGIYAGGAGLPLAVSSVYPIGNEFVRVDRESLEIIEAGHERCEEIERAAGVIQRTAFVDGPFPHISGLIWSRVAIGNMSREVRPLSLIHNAGAANCMPQLWGVWDREYVYEEQEDGATVTNILADQ